MAKNFKELQEKMPREARLRSEASAAKMISEMGLAELRAAMDMTASQYQGSNASALLLAGLSAPLKRSPVARHYLSRARTPLSREQEGNMANIETSGPFETSLNNMHELETFLHAFLGKLKEHELKPGEDVTRYAKEFGLELPAVLKGANIMWDGHGNPHMEAADGRVQTIVLAQPGHPDAVGLVIKCVTIRGWRVCLECGWIWCRIVITKRF